MRALFLISFFTLSIFSVAQDIETTGPMPSHEGDSIRAYYVKHFPDHFFAYPVLKKRSLSFELQRQGNSESLITFKPNNAYSFGVGLYLFELNFEVALAIPIDDKSIALYGKSDARDIQLNVLGKKWGLAAFYQKYSGFYTTDKQNAIASGDPYPQRADIVSRNFGLTSNYVFNNQKFSFRAAYNFAEHQVFSKGSFLLFTSISSFNVAADSSIISPKQQAVFGKDVSFINLKYATFSIAPGYTYSMVFENFFLNGTLSFGPAHNWIKYKLEKGALENETAINSFVVARIGMGYNGERIFGGISFLTQGTKVKFQDNIFSNNNGALKILIGYRFQEFGFLKKRVWDLIPFKI